MKVYIKGGGENETDFAKGGDAIETDFTEDSNENETNFVKECGESENAKNTSDVLEPVPTKKTNKKCNNKVDGNNKKKDTEKLKIYCLYKEVMWQ